jgi:Putative DnaT-like ssDNA binding protein
MALTLIKEDGTGMADANSYADVADGDAYHDGHLYATAWTGATAENKAIALVMATRLIDMQYQFNGLRSVDSQALQWPRVNCLDPDKAPVPVLTSLLLADPFVPPSVIPRAVVSAACEMARELLIADRTGPPRGEGLKYENDGTTQMGYDKTDRPPVISHVAQAMLARFGALIKSGSGTVRLVRA